jgi:hypothetical protein
MPNSVASLSPLSTSRHCPHADQKLTDARPLIVSATEHSANMYKPTFNKWVYSTAAMVSVVSR